VSGLTKLYPELYDNQGEGGRLQHNFSKKWGSYATIVELCAGDIRAIQEIVTLPLEQCLLYLAFKSDRNLLESLMHKEALNR